jgi:hypothetical protein
MHSIDVSNVYPHLEGPPQIGLGLILGGALFYTRVTFETLVVFNFKEP